MGLVTALGDAFKVLGIFGIDLQLIMNFTRRYDETFLLFFLCVLPYVQYLYSACSSTNRVIDSVLTLPLYNTTNDLKNMKKARRSQINS